MLLPERAVTGRRRRDSPEPRGDPKPGRDLELKDSAAERPGSVFFSISNSP